MKSELKSVFAEDPSAVVLGELKVVTLGDEDLPRAASLLEEEPIWVPLAQWGAP